MLAASRVRAGRLDVVGAASVTGAVALLVYGLSLAATRGWSDDFTVQTLGIGAALLVLFVMFELRSPQPLMPLTLFANRNRSVVYALRMIAGATTLSVLFFLTQVMQSVLGYSALQAGFAFLPLGAGVVITAQVASRLIGRTGPRIPIAAGAVQIGHLTSSPVGSG